MKLEGRVLDLFSGRISLAYIYDKDKVTCYELMDDMVHELKSNGIKVVQASIRDKALPFKNKSFDYLFCEAPPLAPYEKKDVYKSEMISGTKAYIKNLIREMIRVTKKKAIINSLPMEYYFQKAYKKRAERPSADKYIIVLNCEKNIKTKKLRITG